MHSGELWQEFDARGERVLNGGRDPKVGNSKIDEPNYTGAAAVWVYRRTDTGVEVLFQKRSQYVDRNAGYWDVSATGHVNYGESWIEAAVREANEEIGVEVELERLTFGFSIRHVYEDRGMVSRVYFYDYTGLEDDFHFDDREVEKVEWVPIQEFDAFVEKYAKKPLKTFKYALMMTKDWLSGEGI